MGTTNFNNTNSYTGCNDYLNCIANTYTLGSRTGKARMITMQEALALGCTTSSKSCPKFMNNYLSESTGNGGTVNDTTGGDNSIYWTMSANSSDTNDAWYVAHSGFVYYGTASASGGARAVVVVSK